MLLLSFLACGELGSLPDLDGDAQNTRDCARLDAAVYVGAAEIANGTDDNCDGRIDENTEAADDDGDRFSDLAGDCNDADGGVYPGQNEVENNVDDDCDGAVDEGTDAADDDGDGVSENEGDCDDADPTRSPLFSEACDGADDDCDEVIDDGFDIDADGFTACGGDNDDLDPTVYPGAAELCDGVDNDQDALLDELCDVDADGFTPFEGDCDDARADVFPGAPERCDGADNDCDGRADGRSELADDPDKDGFACENDCDESNAFIHAGAAEVPNFADDDCDGTVDEGWDVDGDGYIPAEDGEIYTSDRDCSDLQGDVNPGAAELCNGQDDDCDGALDEGFDADGDGFTSCGGDCDDATAARNPDATEVCDGIDQDCNGVADEGFDADSDGTADCFDIEECDELDNDGDGDIDEGFDVDTDGYTSCGGDCDDDDAGAWPGNTEAYDEVDNDCDGSTDEEIGLLVAADMYLEVQPDDSVSTSIPLPTVYAEWMVAVLPDALMDNNGSGQCEFWYSASRSGSAVDVDITTRDCGLEYGVDYGTRFSVVLFVADNSAVDLASGHVGVGSNGYADSNSLSTSSGWGDSLGFCAIGEIIDGGSPDTLWDCQWSASSDTVAATLTETNGNGGYSYVGDLFLASGFTNVVVSQQAFRATTAGASLSTAYDESVGQDHLAFVDVYKHNDGGHDDHMWFWTDHTQAVDGEAFDFNFRGNESSVVGEVFQLDGDFLYWKNGAYVSHSAVVAAGAGAVRY